MEKKNFYWMSEKFTKKIVNTQSKGWKRTFENFHLIQQSNSMKLKSESHISEILKKLMC